MYFRLLANKEEDPILEGIYLHNGDHNWVQSCAFSLTDKKIRPQQKIRTWV